MAANARVAKANKKKNSLMELGDLAHPLKVQSCMCMPFFDILDRCNWWTILRVRRVRFNMLFFKMRGYTNFVDSFWLVSCRIGLPFLLVRWLGTLWSFLQKLSGAQTHGQLAIVSWQYMVPLVYQLTKFYWHYRIRTLLLDVLGLNFLLVVYQYSLRTI